MPISTEPPFAPPVMQCVASAANEFKVPRIVLLAIIKTESNGNPKALHRNDNGTVDIGIMQINSTWASKLSYEYGIKNVRKHLAETCYNIRVGAWILGRELAINEGWKNNRDFWIRIGNYHSKSTAYNHDYQRKLAKNIKWIAYNTKWW